MSLNAIPNDPNADSYSTVAEASAYFDVNLYATDWFNVIDDTREVALKMATRLFDEKFTWVGTKATEEQSLQWGRNNVLIDGYAIDNNVIPLNLKNACAEYAKQLLVEDPAEATGEVGKGLKSLKVDTLKFEFDKESSGESASNISGIQPNIIQMLVDIGTIYTTGGFQMIPLERS